MLRLPSSSLHLTRPSQILRLAMATAILSPHDCFSSSPHGRRNHQLSDMISRSASAPRSGRYALQRLLPSPSSPDSARRNSSVDAGVRDVLDHRNSSPGLLPLPDNRFHSPHSTKHLSSKRTAASHLPFSPSPTSALPSSFSTAKVATSRSSSVGLPPRGSAGRDRLNSLSGKVGQGSVVGSRAVDATFHVQRDDIQASKFVEVKSGLEKKLTSGSEYVSDLRKRTHLDFSSRQGLLEKDGLTSFRKVPAEVQRKEVEGKKSGKRRQGERVLSGKDACEKVSGASVTILQKPKDKEAADELIARFFKKVDRSSSHKEVSNVEIENQGGRSQDSSCFRKRDTTAASVNAVFEPDVMNKDGRSEDQATVVPRVENLPPGSQHLAVCENPFMAKKEETPHEVIDTSVCKRDIEMDVAAGEFSKHLALMVGNDKWLPMVDNEWWAGPAYYNSPPPSSLPLPKFSMKQSRTSSVELSPIRDQYVESMPDRLSSVRAVLPPFSSQLKTSGRSCLPIHEHEAAWDVAFATKDLRRILNLDSC